MKSRFKLVNFFTTQISVGWTPWTSATWTITVSSHTVSGYTLEEWDYLFWIIVNFTNTAQRELFRITSVEHSWAWAILTFDRRFSPEGTAIDHAEWTSVQINDIAETFNKLFLNVDDVGEVDYSGSWLDVTVYWGKYSINYVSYSLADQEITLTDNTTNYIIVDYSDNTIKSVTTLPTAYYLIATLITSWWDITSLSDNRTTVLPVKFGTGFTVDWDGVVNWTEASVETAANVWTWVWKVYKEKTAKEFKLKSIKAWANITIVNDTDDIIITATGALTWDVDGGSY